MRRSYEISELEINNKLISKIVIDPHVDKHSDHITDELIIEVVSMLDKQIYNPVKKKGGFSYFATNIKYNKSWYKLVWILEKNSLYIGVITLYRDRRLK